MHLVGKTSGAVLFFEEVSIRVFFPAVGYFNWRIHTGSYSEIVKLLAARQCVSSLADASCVIFFYQPLSSLVCPFQSASFFLIVQETLSFSVDRFSIDTVIIFYRPIFKKEENFWYHCANYGSLVDTSASPSNLSIWIHSSRNVHQASGSQGRKVDEISFWRVEKNARAWYFSLFSLSPVCFLSCLSYVRFFRTKVFSVFLQSSFHMIYLCCSGIFWWRSTFIRSSEGWTASEMVFRYFTNDW